MLVQNMASLTISTMALSTMRNMKKNKMLQISRNVQISYFLDLLKFGINEILVFNWFTT